MIHFIRPAWFFALIPAILYLVWMMYSFREKNPWKNICDPHLLPALLLPSPNTSQRLFHFILFLFFSVSIFALAGPAWKKIQLPIYRDVASLMLVLDLSSAMESADINPDRLTRAKFKIRDMINTEQNIQMGLVAFTSEAFVAAPLSRDANTLNALIDELTPQMMPVSGSDMTQGLTQATGLLKQSGITHGNILLVTASVPSASSWEAAKAIAQTGNRLDVLAMLPANTATQTTIEQLKQLANDGGGTLYLFSADATDIQNILSNNNKRQVLKDENVENAYLWQDAGPWFCLLLIPLALMVLREKVRYEK